MTKIRSSEQVYIDAGLDHNGFKSTNLANGVAASDAVTVGQLDNAVLGLNSAIHAPAADLAAAKVVVAAERVDRMIILIETLGLYRYDAQSLDVSNDNTVIRPTDLASDAVAGRWVKMSSTITDHNNLSGLQGGAIADYQHLTTAQVNKLNGIEAAADVTDATNVGAAINGSTTTVTPLDTDHFAFLDGTVLSKITFTGVKAFLKTYFDTLYNKYVHPNHSGDITSVADGATTIAANVVTNTKLADMAANSIKGNNTAGVADPKDLTATEVRALINVADGANNYTHPSHTGDVTGAAALTIANNAVTNAKAAQMAANTFKGNNTGALANAVDMTAAQARAVLNVADGANAYAHPNHTGDVTSTGDGALTIGVDKVTNSHLANMAVNTIKGRITAGTNDPEDLSVTQVKSMLGLTVANQSTRYYRAIPSGLINGVNAVFTITANVLTGTEEVFKNGVLQNLTSDYSISYGATTTITMATAPSSSGYADVIVVNYSI